mgnify:CR=1 FL=1
MTERKSSTREEGKARKNLLPQKLFPKGDPIGDELRRIIADGERAAKDVTMHVSAKASGASQKAKEPKKEGSGMVYVATSFGVVTVPIEEVKSAMPGIISQDRAYSNLPD